jgi:predicted secreted protein
MPFGIRTHREMGEELIPGQSHSAPANFRPGRIALLTTAISTVLMALFYLNYSNGWVTAHSLLWLFPLPAFMTASAH